MEPQPNFEENQNNNDAQNPEAPDAERNPGPTHEMGEIALGSYKNEIVPDDDSDNVAESSTESLLANKDDYSVAKADISSEEVSAFSIGMSAVEKRFGKEATDHIENELIKIDSIRNETLSSLEEKEELTPGLRKMARSLSLKGVNAYNLTPEETSLVYDYATNATPEIERAKIDRVFDAFHRHINSPSGRRDGLEPAFYNPEEAERKAELLDRYRDWDRGKIDLSRGFDPERVYRRLVESEGYEEGPYLKGMLEEGELEDLLEDGLVEDDDLYVYGPLTSRDIEDIEFFNSSTWTDATSWRYNLNRKTTTVKKPDANGNIKKYKIESERAGASLASLIGDTVAANASGIESDLIHDYIAREILQNRRLKSKDLLMASSAIALDIIDNGVPNDEDKKKIYNSAKKTCSWIAYYAAEALGYRKSELKERYGSTRPADREFFEEIATTSSQLTDERSKYLDKYFPQTFTKIDEHLHELLDRLIDLEEGDPMAGEEWD